MPDALESIAKFQVATTGSHNSVAFAGALIVYFSILGFFCGYLVTRLFLARAFEDADTAITKWRQLQNFESVSAITRLKMRRKETKGMAEERVESRAPDEDDPQKGKWGGAHEANGRILTAEVAPTDDEDWFEVSLKVASTDPAKPLKGMVTFHLHDSFPDPDPKVKVKRGVASLDFLAYGAFTVGAEADNGATKLELDLASLPDVPEGFREG